jgi:hypothetical protein
MSDHIQKTIDDALIELRKHEDSVLSTKKLINQLCVFGKLPLMFANLDEAGAGTTPRGTIRRNAYYGQPLASCVRDILEMRKSIGLGEASLDEIMAALKEGSFDLATVSKDAEGQKRGVAISLAKNSVTFHRLPNGDFGLLTWYPNVKAKKEKAADTYSAAPEGDSTPAQPPAPAAAASE